MLANLFFNGQESKRNHSLRRAGFTDFYMALRLLFPLIAVSVAQSQSTSGLPSVRAGGVVTASNFGGYASVAPGSWIEVYGSNFAASARSWNAADFQGNNAPTSLDGVSVTISGQRLFVAYISASQINAQIPFSISLGSQPLVVTTPVGSSNPYAVTVNPIQPGLLSPASFKLAGKQYVAALFSDGQTFALPENAIPGIKSRSPHSGDLLTIYGVGFGPVNPTIPAGQTVQNNNSLNSPVAFSIGNAAAEVTYQGLAPGAIGLYQFNVTVPNVASSDASAIGFSPNMTAAAPALFLPISNSGLPALTSVRFLQNPIFGGGSLPGSVTLSQPALESGAAVSLTSSDRLVTVPAVVVVPPGKTTANFLASSTVSSTNRTVVVTARYAGTSDTINLSITAGSQTAPIKQLTLTLYVNPQGYASQYQGILTVKPENGLSTVTIGTGLFGFIHCSAPANPVIRVAGSAAYSCPTLDPQETYLPFPAISFPAVSKATLEFALGTLLTVDNSTAYGVWSGVLNATYASGQAIPPTNVSGYYYAAF